MNGRGGAWREGLRCPTMRSNQQSVTLNHDCRSSLATTHLTSSLSRTVVAPISRLREVSCRSNVFGLGNTLQGYDLIALCAKGARARRRQVDAAVGMRFSPRGVETSFAHVPSGSRRGATWAALQHVIGKKSCFLAIVGARIIARLCAAWGPARRARRRRAG